MNNNLSLYTPMVEIKNVRGNSPEEQKIQDEFIAKIEKNKAIEKENERLAKWKKFGVDWDTSRIDFSDKKPAQEAQEILQKGINFLQIPAMFNPLSFAMWEVANLTNKAIGKAIDVVYNDKIDYTDLIDFGIEVNNTDEKMKKKFNVSIIPDNPLKGRLPF